MKVTKEYLKSFKSETGNPTGIVSTGGLNNAEYLVANKEKG